MSSPPVLDIDSLVQPIPGSDPAGPPLPDAILRELDTLRKEPDPENEYTRNLPPADWGKIIRVASDALATKSKDLIVALRLTEAATKKEGVLGLRDGLRLLQRLVAECWDRMHPVPGEGEGMDIREGPFKWANDVTRGGKFPFTVTGMHLFRVPGQGAYSYHDWLTPDKRAELEGALTTVKADDIRRAYADLNDARQALKDLAAALDEKLGADVAPDFLSPETTGNLGNAIRQCIEFTEEVAKKRGVALKDDPAAGANGQPTGAAGGDGGAAAMATGPVGVAGTREGLYRQLHQIADALRVIEPHSPVPFLLERCVRLGAMPFPDLMRQIVREAATLDELDRLLGLEKKDAAAG